MFIIIFCLFTTRVAERADEEAVPARKSADRAGELHAAEPQRAGPTGQTGPTGSGPTGPTGSAGPGPTGPAASVGGGDGDRRLADAQQLQPAAEHVPPAGWGREQGEGAGGRGRGAARGAARSRPELHGRRTDGRAADGRRGRGGGRGEGGGGGRGPRQPSAGAVHRDTDQAAAGQPGTRESIHLLTRLLTVSS